MSRTTRIPSIRQQKSNFHSFSDFQTETSGCFKNVQRHEFWEYSIEMGFWHSIQGFRDRFIGLYLVEFGVEWCGTCHIIAPILEELSRKYAALVMVGWVDSEYNKNLTEMYGIINHPTILFFHCGEIIDYLIGSFAYEEITQRIENVLSNKANLISETKSNNNKEN